METLVEISQILESQNLDKQIYLTLEYMYQEASDNTSKRNGETILRPSSTIYQKNSGADTEFGRKNNEVYVDNVKCEVPVRHLKRDVP